MSTSWGAKPNAAVAPVPETGPLSAPPAAVAVAEAPAEPAPEPELPTIQMDPASLVANKARDMLAGLRG